MIDFTTLQGLTIPEGVVTQITDASGRVLWALSGGKIVLEVEKITATTYAGETSYADETFILLDIYPKTNSTVTVTYGGLTKTITDTSGAEEPNAQQVYFGTFNGVSDSVTTPESGTLTIMGDCLAFACGSYQNGSKDSSVGYCACIYRVDSFGMVNDIPEYAFRGKTLKQTSLEIPSTVKRIGQYAFNVGASGASESMLSNVSIANGVERICGYAFSYCVSLASVNIPASVKEMGYTAIEVLSSLQVSWNNPFPHVAASISLDERNPYFRIDGNCLIEIATSKVVCGVNNDIDIPSYITGLMGNCFCGRKLLTHITIPAGVTDIPTGAFEGTGLTSVTIPPNVIDIGIKAFNTESLTSVTLLPTTPPEVEGSGDNASFHNNTTFIVPKGCGETYKKAVGWSDYADRIVEAS